MGTIVTRQLKSGAVRFLAKISITRAGQIVHRENKTFERRPAATAWIKKRESELALPGEIDRAKTKGITLADAIDKYNVESVKEAGKTKAQVLRTIKKHPIAARSAASITSQDIVSLAAEVAASASPATAGNYLSHLSSIFTVAKPAWGYELDRQAMDDAQVVARQLGLIGKSKQRSRRPTMDELDLIMAHFANRQARRPSSVPMVHVVAFAIFSTRRQEEIIRITWADLDEQHSRILVRDMKNPGDKIGNDVWCELPDEAMRIIKAMPRVADQIFPFSTDAISAAFTRACQFLCIEDLRFHDLRHDGVSRLFETGRTIPLAASVSGHRSWQSLQRYTHIRETGDKYAGWKWIDAATVAPPRFRLTRHGQMPRRRRSER